MDHRPPSVVQAELKAAQAVVRALKAEQRAERADRHARIIRQFDAGMSGRDIARDQGININTVFWVLGQHDRTTRGRYARRQQIDAHVRRPEQVQA
jgi:hypothetical protein